MAPSEPRRLGNTRLVLRYGAFAALATVANLSLQRLIFQITPHEIRLIAALIAGTGAGLVVKYILDKKMDIF